MIMAKDRQLEGHKQGMAYAYQIITKCEPGKEREALAEEIKFRGLLNVPITVPRRTIEEAIEKMKLNTIQTMLAMWCMVLHDEFGFGKKRLQQAVERFNLKVDCLCEGYVTWQDYIDTLKDEVDIELEITNLVAGRR